jgi:hypothetical protein
MYYTYILSSLVNPDHFYIGSTSDLKRRFSEHNSGNSIHTNKLTPYRTKKSIYFKTQDKLIPCILWIATCLIVEVSAGLITQSSVNSWYKTLIKPEFTLPKWIFAPVWSCCI